MKKWILSITILLVCIISWQGYIYFHNVFEPQTVQEKRAVEKIKNTYQIKEISDIKYYPGLSKSYQVAEATTDENSKVYIWVSETDDETFIVDTASGWNKQKVLEKVRSEENPKKIIRITPGLEGNQSNRRPVWEVVFLDQEERYTFYYLDFIDGNHLQTYRLNKET
jgi:uncharacterized protein YpmB